MVNYCLCKHCSIYLVKKKELLSSTLTCTHFFLLHFFVSLFASSSPFTLSYCFSSSSLSALLPTQLLPCLSSQPFSPSPFPLTTSPLFWIDLLCRISLCLSTTVAHSQLWFSHQQFVALPWWNPATNRIPSYEKNFLYGNYRFEWEGYFYCGNPSISTPFFAETKISFTSV